MSEPAPAIVHTDRLARADAVATAAMIADGEVSARDVVAAATARTAAVAERLGGVAAPLYARARARVADGVPQGDLAGVPTAVKEIVGIAGVPFTQGSRAWHGHRSARTWDAVRQHLATGLVAVATTTMSEFGLTPTTEPLGRSATRNPWAPAHTPGGSSGGAAVLVAAGAVPIAFGTDGGGSIRIPAACCGLVGLKPSRGRMVPLGEVDRTPIPLAVHGVLARSVRDVAAYHAAAERAAPAPGGLPGIGHVTRPDPRRLRVGVVTAAANGALVDRDVVAAVEHTAGVLDGLGHRVVPLAPAVGGGFSEDLRDYFGYLANGLGVVSRNLVGAGYDPALQDPWTRALAARGRRALPRLPVVIRRLRAAVARERAVFGSVDVVLSPVTSAPAPRLGHLAGSVPFDTLYERISSWMAFTPIQNVAGTPAIAVPSRPARTGLPVGVQLAGLVGDEAQLLSLALELEDADPWPQLAPAAAELVAGS